MSEVGEGQSSFLHAPSLYPFVRKARLYPEAFSSHLPAVGFGFHFAAGEISLLTHGFSRKADVDKVLLTPNPDGRGREGLACALTERRAEP